MENYENSTLAKYRKYYYQKNKEHIKEYAKEYYQKNKDDILDKRKEYFKKWYHNQKIKKNKIYSNNIEIGPKIVKEIIVRF